MRKLGGLSATSTMPEMRSSSTRRAADQHLAIDARDRLRPGAQLQRLRRRLVASGVGGIVGLASVMAASPARRHRCGRCARPLRRRAEPQLGGGEQPIDDVGRAAARGS